MNRLNENDYSQHEFSAEGCVFVFWILGEEGSRYFID